MTNRVAKRARYIERLHQRVLGISSDKTPVEITPEIQRELDTPLDKLPVDHVIRGAMRRAGTGTNYLAHIRLAKLRRAKREATRAKNAQRTAGARDQHRTHGDRSRERVRAAFLALRAPDIKRTEAAKLICGRVNLSRARTLTILKDLKLPPKK